MSRRSNTRKFMKWKRYVRRCNQVSEWHHRIPLGFVRHVYKEIQR